MAKLSFLSILIAVATLAILSGCGSSNAAPPTGDAKESFKQVVEKSGGDYSKLTPQEQKMADDASRGHGVQFVKNQYLAAHPQPTTP